MLRASISEADRFYLAATNGEQRRTAILMALRGVLEFNKSIIPSIESLALTRHFEKFTDLSIGQPDETFRKSRGHGLTTAGEEKARDGLIAVAFTILTEGGRRKGNMPREEAGRFIATELNKLGIGDRGARFTSSRVVNTYLEVIRTPRSARARRRPASAAEAAIATIRDRARGWGRRIYTDQMNDIAAWKAAGEKAGEFPKPFRTMEGRKKLATSFIRRLATNTFLNR